MTLVDRKMSLSRAIVLLLVEEENIGTGTCMQGGQ
jgi:hypothetical protein